MKHLKTLTYNNLNWITIDKPTTKQINWIRQNFKFRKDDLDECTPILQRPKINIREDYLFMVLQFPYYDRQTAEIKSSEVDFFITKNTLITFHSGNLEPILEIERLIEKDDEFKKQTMVDSSKLLYEILNRLLHYCFTILNHVNSDIEKIESQIFNVKEKKLEIIREILRIKRNIVNIRKIMQAHKSIISKLIKNYEQIYLTNHLHKYFNHLVNHTKDIWDFLENYKDTIDALHETHESLLSHSLNDIIKTLTIFSVIVFPLTLLAAIFGMNTMNSMPFINSPYDFWWVVIIMFVGVIGMLIFFKNKKWM
jgi:magnesium transporter